MVVNLHNFWMGIKKLHDMVKIQRFVFFIQALFHCNEELVILIVIKGHTYMRTVKEGIFFFKKNTVSQNHYGHRTRAMRHFDLDIKLDA